MNELGAEVPAGLAEQFATEGKTPLFFAKNGELAGTIAVADEVKETSAGAIAALRSLGVDVRMLTGDNRVTAEAIARRVGLSSDLMDVARAIELSRATIRNIKQDLFWALFYNGIGIPLAAGAFFPLTGWQLSPMFGAAAMSLSSVCVVSNALRLRTFKPSVAVK